MRSLLPFRSRRHDCEWIGGRYTLPNKVRVGDVVVQPEVVLWLELPRGVIVGTKITVPGEPVPFAETLKDSMKHPAEGSPRQPSRIRVPEAQLAEALRGAIGSGVPVIIAPVPELDAAFADLTHAIAGTEPRPAYQSYLGGGAISPAVVARLFSAASILFRAAPWRHVSEEQILRVDIPRLAVDGGCLSVIGGAGESFGLLLFRSIEAYKAFASGPPAPASEEELFAPRPDREASLLSLSFDRKKDLPSSMQREIEHHRWSVAGAKAYPALIALDTDAIPLQPTERAFQIMTVCTSAFLAFLASHRNLFDADDPETICESFTSDDDVTVTLTAPYGTNALFDVEDFFSPEADAFLERTPTRPAAGRNDPCPCGSGKKYKKCHLDADRSGKELTSESAPVHEMDFRLVSSIGRFASSRFGDSWLGRPAEDFKDDEAALQLFPPWVAWTAVVDGKRIADVFFEEKGARLSSDERDWFDAQRRVWLSVWEVTRVVPGTIDVRDPLTGQKRSVREGRGSRLVVARDALLARVVDFHGLSLFDGMYGRALPPADALEVIRSVRSKLRVSKGDVAVERLQDPKIGRFMIDRWREAVDDLDRRASIPPVLENTDGDPLLFVTESFQFENSARAEIEERLLKMDGLDDVRTANGESELTFVRLGNPLHKSWENTVMGRVIVARDTVRIETNSERRADALRRRVRDACGRNIRDGVRQAESPSSLPRASERGTPPPGMSPTEQALLRELKEAHYREWIDTAIPALGGKTPREAARSTKSREKLDLLLREIENRENRLPEAERFAIERLRRELRLDP
ncbi:MAG TPA: SEC-C metal-binding domain-containing protein [Thermoanaerobaculia bacterium]|nr:SEC-C metal-binding domain-containing protein [Thermoanaerobaculia bacterium]